MQPKAKTVIIYSLLLAWLISCMIVYVSISRAGHVQLTTINNWNYIVDMLNHISASKYLSDLFSALPGTILFSLTCLSLGLWVLRKWMQLQAPNLALGITALIVGEIIFSVIFLTAISLYYLTPGFVAITSFLGFLMGFPSLKEFASSLPYPRLPRDFNASERIILFLSVTGLFLGLSLSFTRLGYDATAEYFSHAKIMAVSQSPVFFYPKDFFVVSSFHPGILFTAIIQLFGDQPARMWSWVNGMAITLMGLAIIRELGLKPRTGLWFSSLMLTSTAFVDLLGDGKLELISTAPILAAAYWMLRSVEQPSKGTFSLIGLLTGFAIISRPYNIFLVSIFTFLFYAVLLYFRVNLKAFDTRQFVRFALWGLPPVFLLGVFHLLENWFFLGSPFAPVAYARALGSNDWQWQLDPRNLNLYRLFYPFTLTFVNTPQSLGNISPLLVGSLPFLIVKDIRKNIQNPARLNWLIIITLTTLLFWITLYFTVLEIRYVLFLWVLLFIAMAQVTEGIIQNSATSIRPIFDLLVIILLAAMGIRTSLIALITYFPPDNIENGEAYCPDSNLCSYLETVNGSASPGDRVLALQAYRYYLRPDLFACSSQVDEYNILEPYARQNSPTFWVKTYQRGFRYILYEQHLSERRYQFGNIPNPDTAPDWMKVKLVFSSTSGNQLIYQIDTVNPPFPPEVSCKKNSSGIWELQSVQSLVQ